MALIPYDDKIQSDLDRAKSLIPKKAATNTGAAKAVKQGGLVDVGNKIGSGRNRAKTPNMTGGAGARQTLGQGLGSVARGTVDYFKELPANYQRGAQVGTDMLMTGINKVTGPVVEGFKEGFGGSEPIQAPVDQSPKTPAQVNATGQAPALSAETTANAVLNPAAAVQESPRTIVQSDETGKVTGLDVFPPPSSDVGPITAIRGTQQETINLAGVPQGGAPGLETLGVQTGDARVNLDPNAAEFDAFIPGAYDMTTARAAAKADEIRRNPYVLHTDSDAVAVAKMQGANNAASDYLKANTEGATDKEKLAAEKALGLETLGVRRAEIAGREKVANINAKAGTGIDYKKTLEQAMEFDRNQYYNQLRKFQEDMNEETKQRNLEAMQEARPTWYKEFMAQEY